MGDKRNESKKRRKPYRNSILRLIYLYRCFDKNELANILKIGSRTLDNETGIFRELLDGRYAIRRKNNDKPVKAGGEDYVSVNRLWEVYDLASETKNILKNAEQYSNFLYGIECVLLKLEEDSDEDINDLLNTAFDNYVLPFLDDNLSEIRSKVARSEEYNSETSFEAKTTFDDRLSELSRMGVIEKTKGVNGIMDNELEGMLIRGDVEYNSLYNLICYSMHFLHPAIYGYELVKLIRRIARQDEVTPTEPFIKYSGYQAQSILSNEKCIDILDCIRNKKVIEFNYIQNAGSVIEHEERSNSEAKNILPYKLLYDIRYGRYYMLGLNIEDLDNDNALQRFQVEYMEGLSASDKSLKYYGIKKKACDDLMERLYHRLYEGTWTSRGIPEGKNYYRKITLLRRFLDENRKPVQSDYERYLPCKYSGYDENEGTYYIIVPNYLDIKSWVLEHSMADGVGWFEVVRDEPVVRDDADNWSIISDLNSEEDSLINNLRDTFTAMEKYYEFQ